MVAVEPAEAVGAEIVYHVSCTSPLRVLGELHARDVRASSAPRPWCRVNQPSLHMSGLPHASSRTPRATNPEGSPTRGLDPYAIPCDLALRPESHRTTADRPRHSSDATD